MMDDYTPRHHLIQEYMECHAEMSVWDLVDLAARLPCDLEHFTAAAWDLVEDGELTYHQDAHFRKANK